jgi:hypothetical protein
MNNPVNDTAFAADYCDPILIEEGDYASKEDYLAWMDKTGKELLVWAKTPEGQEAFRQMRGAREEEEAGELATI